MYTKHTIKFSLEGKPKQTTMNLETEKDLHHQANKFLEEYHGYGKNIVIHSIKKATHSLNFKGGFGNPRHYRS